MAGIQLARLVTLCSSAFCWQRESALIYRMIPNMQPVVLTATAPYQTGLCCQPVIADMAHVLESALTQYADSPAIFAAPGSLQLTLMQPELESVSSHRIQALPVQQQQQQCHWDEYVAVQSQQDCSSLSALLLQYQHSMTKIGSSAVSPQLGTYSSPAVVQLSLEGGGQQQFLGQFQLPQLPLLPSCSLDTNSTAYQPTMPADGTCHTLVEQLIGLRCDNKVEIYPGGGSEHHNLGTSSSQAQAMLAAYSDTLQHAAGMTAMAAAPQMAASSPKLCSKRVKRASHLHKTELCRNWQLAAWCAHGGACQFAHGILELRPKCKPPSYKTQFCRAFHTNGKCSYGADCNFLHGAEDLASLVGVKDVIIQ